MDLRESAYSRFQPRICLIDMLLWQCQQETKPPQYAPSVRKKKTPRVSVPTDTDFPTIGDSMNRLWTWWLQTSLTNSLRPAVDMLSQQQKTALCIFWPFSVPSPEGSRFWPVGAQLLMSHRPGKRRHNCLSDPSWAPVFPILLPRKPPNIFMHKNEITGTLEVGDGCVYRAVEVELAPVYKGDECKICSQLSRQQQRMWGERERRNSGLFRRTMSHQQLEHPH